MRRRLTARNIRRCPVECLDVVNGDLANLRPALSPADTPCRRAIGRARYAWGFLRVVVALSPGPSPTISFPNQ